MTQSTINPAVPVPGQPLDATVVQANFAAAWSDINGILSSAGQGANALIRGIYATIDGGGSQITTGIKGFLYVPYACVLQSWTMLADTTGSAVVDIWKVPYASFPPNSGNSITAGAPPTITTGQNGQSSNLSGVWATTVAAGDVLAFNVNSCATITRLNLTLKASAS